MPQIVINDTIITVWSAGIQIQKTHLPTKTFYSKHAIASLSTVKTTTHSILLYVPVHTQNQGGQEIISWYSEKPSPNYAASAYDFIMTHLYSADLATDDDLIKDSGLYT